MPLMKYRDPFRFLEQLVPDVTEMEQQFNEMMESALGEWMRLPERFGLSDLYRMRLRPSAEMLPRMDTLKKGEDLVLRLELPGVNKDDLHIEVEEGLLIIAGKHHDEAERQEEGYISRESFSGEFRRTVRLPQDITADNIAAHFEEGILDITLQGAAKALESRGRSIEIETGEEANHAEAGKTEIEAETKASLKAVPEEKRRQKE
ncbi:MAG: Hsp20/alpha crystallin family protein [Candidatus Geothermincolia bacterium]